MRLKTICMVGMTAFLLGWAANTYMLSALNKEDAYGIRHDRELSDYEKVAAGQSTEDVPDFSPVVFFGYSLDGSDRSDFIASGVLIAPRWILTAGHNFYNAEEQKSPAPAQGILAAVGNDPNTPDALYEIEKLIFHPTWTEGEQNYGNGNDLCLVKLAEPITTIKPAILHKSAQEQLGQTVWHAGFGIYSDEPGQNANLDSKKHAIQNTLDRIQGGLKTHKDGITYIGGLLTLMLLMRALIPLMMILFITMKLILGPEIAQQQPFIWRVQPLLVIVVGHYTLSITTDGKLPVFSLAVLLSL